MTAQPEVVWVYGDVDGWWRCSPTKLRHGDSIPYVSQASLTAALAERDEARAEILANGAKYVEACQHFVDRMQETMAERDKLAKALALAEFWVPTFDERRADAHCERHNVCAECCAPWPCYFEIERRTSYQVFLTAQAAQGEKNRQDKAAPLPSRIDGGSADAGTKT